MAYRKGVLVYSQPDGLPPEALEDVVTQVKTIDMDEDRKDLTTRATSRLGSKRNTQPVGCFGGPSDPAG
jgi:hypothetical protein